MYSEKSNGPKVEPWGTPSGQCRNGDFNTANFCIKSILCCSGVTRQVKSRKAWRGSC